MSQERERQHQRPVNLPLPSKLDTKGNLATNWKRFHRMWTNYEIASGLKSQENKIRAATLLTCIGTDALDIIDGLPLQETEKDDCDRILELMGSHCIGEVNETYERYVFNKRNQEPNETIDSYVTALRNLAKTCNYKDLEDNLIRDRIVVGLRDSDTAKLLLSEPKLTLQLCIDKCRAQEATTRQVKAINQEDVHYVKGKQQKIPGTQKTPRQETKRIQGHKDMKPRWSQCKFCGKHHKFRKSECPAYGKTCSRCSGKNHFATSPVCEGYRSKNQKQHVKGGKVYTVENEDSSDEEYALQVESTARYQKRLYAKMKVNNKEIRFQIDCGATVNVLPKEMYIKAFQDPDLTKLRPANTTLIMYDKSHVNLLGKIKTTVVNPRNNIEYNIDLMVVDGETSPLLGSPTSQEMNLITVNSENISICEDSLTRETLIDNYKDIFTGEGHFTEKLHLQVDEKVTPVKLPLRKIPLALKPKLKKEIDRLTNLGIIQPIEVPTDWISAMVIVMKKNGKVRLCIDPKPLNKGLKRNHYPLPVVQDILPELNKAKIFSVFDAKNGFWHVELDEDSSVLTTFETPWGKYKWLRMPMGISPAPEEFQRRLNNILAGLQGTLAVADDIIVYGKGETREAALEDHNRNIVALMNRCREKGLKLNKEKLKFQQNEVPFLGHLITENGLKVDPSKVEAISRMPIPEDKKAVQRLLGMVNYVRDFIPRLSEKTEPLRNLIKEDSEFIWREETHGKCFEEIKELLTNAPVLKYFDVNEAVVLQCDSSEKGIGACLFQGGRPVVYHSRALTPTECNYAQIEKELLAVVSAAKKFHRYIYGRKVKVESDHKPLEVICRKSLLSAPKRLQRMLLAIQMYDLDIVYKKGTELYFADTLSRAYIPREVSSREEEFESVNNIDYLPISEKTLNFILSATVDDTELGKLKKIIQSGWPDTPDELDEVTRSYYTFRDELVVQNGLIFKGERLVIPTSAKQNIMERIHDSHVGVQGCLRRAREVVYWPRMNKEIEEYIMKCSTCREHESQQAKEPLISHEVPDLPWSKIATDLFEVDGKDYLVTTDYYSNYFEVDRLSDKKSKEVITKIKQHLARHGLPNVLISDNGPPFNSAEFARFAEQYEFEHLTSSPGYPQSNGKAENSVKTAKRLIMKAKEDQKDPFLSLLDWRNTPSEGIGSSPVQRLFNRRTRTKLPTSKNLLKPAIPEVSERLKKRKDLQKQYYNKSTKDLCELKPGQIVRIKPFGNQKIWKKAKVDQKIGIRSYQVITQEGTILRRNLRHIRLSREDQIERNKPELLPRPVLGHPRDIDLNRPSSNQSRTMEKPETGNKVDIKIQEETQKMGQLCDNVPRTEYRPKTTRSGRIIKDTRKEDFVYKIK